MNNNPSVSDLQTKQITDPTEPGADQQSPSLPDTDSKPLELDTQQTNPQQSSSRCDSDPLEPGADQTKPQQLSSSCDSDPLEPGADQSQPQKLPSLPYGNPMEASAVQSKPQQSPPLPGRDPLKPGANQSKPQQSRLVLPGRQFSKRSKFPQRLFCRTNLYVVSYSSNQRT